VFKMVKALRVIAGLLLLDRILADDFRPSSGELILANQTYLVNWNITGGPSAIYMPIELEIPNMTPPYTSTFDVSSRK
jgi:hypothetical protein